MPKKVTINCNSQSGKVPVDIYVGIPFPGTHPLNFQGRWLSEVKGVTIPQDLMDSLAKLEKVSQENKIPFSELMEYVYQEISLSNSVSSDAKEAFSLSGGAKNG